jgi:hypothetical protein
MGLDVVPASQSDGYAPGPAAEVARIALNRRTWLSW